MEVFEGLRQLWALVRRYEMKTPLLINVVDTQLICLRTLKAERDENGHWQLTDETQPNAECDGKSFVFPLIINSKDRSGNILKVRVQLATKNGSPERETTE